MNALGLGRLRNLEPKKPVQRYQWERPGDMIHVAVDDATCLAYVEVLADEQKATTTGFLARAVGWFSEQGITCRRVLSDNGTACRSGDW
ncbi:DDE-type integrase/transposase/recombinase [Synechococcus sp. GFB01]|uniref:DDE-type integrase/transposase/recombinase n=1 Tax=Synechococcus sp. GFB01 TaxID=1662190 RepID=UPI000AA13563|nr:DDE-type integrase/transposase/recombinase [Synechococcus sp. GFB01]